MKHFDLHECPECGSDGRVRGGYVCNLCDGAGFLNEEEWRDWCTFQADVQPPSYVDGLMTKFGGGHK